MSLIPIIVMFVIGIIAGAFAGSMMRNGGFGTEVNLITGLFGSFAGGVFNMTGGAKIVFGLKLGGLPGMLLWSTIGALIVLSIVGLVFRMSRQSEDD